jgi:hypothetical protein
MKPVRTFRFALAFSFIFFVALHAGFGRTPASGDAVKLKEIPACLQKFVDDRT